MTRTAFDKLTSDEKKLYREQCAKGGKNGSHASKVRAGQAGFRARVKNLTKKPS